MSDHLQPGLHPDPDSLNAFIEGVLPEHERLQCLAHLAECPMCREVVYLAEEPMPSEPLPGPVVPERLSFWKRWFTPIPALSAAMVLGTLVLSFALYQHFKVAPKAPEMVAMATHPSEQPAAEPQATKIGPQVQTSQPTPEKKAPPVKKRTVPQPEAPIAVAQPVSALPVAVPPPPPAPSPEVAAAPSAASPTLPVRTAPLASPAPRAFAAISAGDSAAATGIAGTITDPAGAAIAGVTVKLHPLAGLASRSLTSDPKGQFNVAGLEPGRYELQFIAPGFKQLTEQVNIQPNQMARVDSILPIGSVAESISVTAETARVQTEMSSAARQPALPPLPTFRSANMRVVAGIPAPAGTPLPSHLPASATVVKGKLMLATDSAGALFLSQNAGNKWKAVKPVWVGKAVSLAALSASDSSSGAAFQLTTDSGAVWLSRDGNRWYAAAPGVSKKNN